jgi:hypothetical protein
MLRTTSPWSSLSCLHPPTLHIAGSSWSRAAGILLVIRSVAGPPDHGRWSIEDNPARLLTSPLVHRTAGPYSPQRIQYFILWYRSASRKEHEALLVAANLRSRRRSEPIFPVSNPPLALPCCRVAVLPVARCPLPHAAAAAAAATGAAGCQCQCRWQVKLVRFETPKPHPQHGKPPFEVGIPATSRDGRAGGAPLAPPRRAPGAPKWASRPCNDTQEIATNFWYLFYGGAS